MELEEYSYYNKTKIEEMANQQEIYKKISSVKADDYVEIQKANVADVLYNEWNLNDVVYNILNALQNISRIRYYGMTMLIDVLRGVNSKRIFDNKLDKLSEFGIYKEMPRESIQSIVEWMLSEQYILKTKGKYPVLHSTYEGNHYSESMAESKLIELKKYLEKEVLLWR